MGGRVFYAALASIFNVAGIFGAYLVGVSWLGLDSGIFWPQMQNNITIHYDVINGLIKSAAFGVAVTLIAVHQGFHCIPTSEGICAPARARWFRPP
ncbi:ABC transporter inner membrane protein [Neisseria gonorrhoeae]|uniref:ABC transporter inner membrane protein n=1 Tax=Neisseria gonorrhoeae TaxID=485 RepID=A0A378W358_NEIGO|nr:ABC transporter inner membrane protein [Neisseria gonorrhoeae]